MEVGAGLVADAGSFERVQPGEAAFDTSAGASPPDTLIFIVNDLLEGFEMALSDRVRSYHYSELHRERTNVS